MDRVEKMFGRMKAGKLYKCVDWDPEGKAKDLVDKFNGAPRSETMTRTGEYLGNYSHTWEGVLHRAAILLRLWNKYTCGRLFLCKYRADSPGSV